jgi:hypothetical protein
MIEQLPSRTDLWVARPLAVLGLVFAVYVPLGWGPPSMRELVPAEGILTSYSLYQFPRQRAGNGDLVALMKLAGHSGRFWNDAVKNGLISRLNGAEGSTMRVLYAPRGNPQQTAGDAVKSWGLWVNGVEVESAESALAVDRVSAYVVMPLFGVVFSAIGCWRTCERLHPVDE